MTFLDWIRMALVGLLLLINVYRRRRPVYVGFALFTIFSTTVVPLIGSDAYHRGAWKTRKKPKWAKLFA